MKIVKVNTEIFRGYDIRGVNEKDLSEDVFYTLGKSYATFLFRRQIRDCVVGRDVRLTSEIYQKAFVSALLESGINVIDIGLTLAQIMYFAQYRYLSKGGAIITASHNPKEYNGLKLAVGFSDTLLTDEIQEIRLISDSKKFSSYPNKGTYLTKDVYGDYKEDLFKKIPLKDAGFKVVIDSCNATTGKFLPDILRTAGCTVIEQNTNLDGSFPNGTPDPTEKDVLDRLGKRVVKEKADMGLTYDSDGDRLGIVDDKGNPIWNDILLSIYAQDILQFLPGSSIIINTLCSKGTSESILNAGGKPIMWKVGHSYIKAKVREERAPFGGELSGHFFFMDNFYGHDDGAFATLRLLFYLKRNNFNLEEIIEKLPKYICSPEIKLGLADNIKFKFIDEKINKDIKNALPNAEFIMLDGIRADTKDTMVTIRASQNGPYITVKFESKTKNGYLKIKQIVNNILKKYKEIDWKQGSNTDSLL